MGSFMGTSVFRPELPRDPRSMQRRLGNLRAPDVKGDGFVSDWPVRPAWLQDHGPFIHSSRASMWRRAGERAKKKTGKKRVKS